jgi:hypothetical protein
MSRREPAKFGIVEAEIVPWELRTVKARVATLRQLVNEMRTLSLPEEAFRVEVRRFSVMLRETWERLVEEKLLNDVVRRFSRPVATMRLRGVNVTDDDFKTVFFAMKRASEWAGHDAPIGAVVATPSTDDLTKAIDDLDHYARSLDRDRSRIEQVRKELVPD